MDKSQADESLMLRYRNGDTGAFDGLYARHKAPLYRYLLRQCGNASIAEELFQDIWLKLVNARANYSVKAKFTTYLYRMAHNCLIDHYRSQSRRLPASYLDQDSLDPDLLAAAEHEQPERLEDRRRQAEQLLQAVMTLPEAQREVFLLRAEAGLSLEAIAEATAVSRETAKSRLRYAVTKLRQNLHAETQAAS